MMVRKSDGGHVVGAVMRTSLDFKHLYQHGETEDDFLKRVKGVVKPKPELGNDQHP